MLMNLIMKYPVLAQLLVGAGVLASVWHSIMNLIPRATAWAMPWAIKIARWLVLTWLVQHPAMAKAVVKYWPQIKEFAESAGAAAQQVVAAFGTEVNKDVTQLSIKPQP